MSNLDLVPDAALPDMQWAYDAVIANRVAQTALLQELRERLARHGVPPVSMSGLNRWVLRIRAGAVRRPGGAPPPPSGSVFSQHTLGLVAAALRAVADDLEGSRT